MKRDDLRNLGLTKEIINQIMTWNGYDIEAGKKKLKETERIMEELKAELEAVKLKGNRKEEKPVCSDSCDKYIILNLR